MTFAEALTAWGLNATLGVGRDLGYAQGKVTAAARLSSLGPWYDASGTCRMGPSPKEGAVVDPAMQVHGVQGLHVA